MTDDNQTNPSTPAPGADKPPHKKESIWEVYWPKEPNSEREAVPVASFPMIIYFWPTMFMFLACGLLQNLGWVSAETLGWWAVAALSFNLMVIVTDLDQKKFTIAVLSCLLLGVLAYISHDKGFGLVDGIASWLGNREVTLSTDAYFILFGTLWFFFCIGMLQPRFNYWRLEPNEFVHYIQPFGRDQSIPRQGSTVSREVPDLLELLLTFGGGTLVIRREDQVVRIQHVPFLGRRMKAIEQLLGVTRVKNV